VRKTTAQRPCHHQHLESVNGRIQRLKPGALAVPGFTFLELPILWPLYRTVEGVSVMNFGVIATTVLLGLTIVLAPAALDTAASGSQRTPNTRLAQASQDVTGATTNKLQGIGLTASHKRIIYDNIASEQAQTLSGDPQFAVGNTIPDSLVLNTMPIAVKDQIGLLKDFKFVKLTGDNILIVDPANRKIVDIITKQDAGQ
jgi:hypothetical protein